MYQKLQLVSKIISRLTLNESIEFLSHATTSVKLPSSRCISLSGVEILAYSQLCELLPISSLETTSELEEFSRIGSSETDLTLSKYNGFKTVLVKFEVMFIPSSSLNFQADHLLHSVKAAFAVVPTDKICGRNIP